jgi:hypothetical protein
MSYGAFGSTINNHGTSLPGFHSDTAEFHYRLDGDLTDSGTGSVYGSLGGTYDQAPYMNVSCARTTGVIHSGSVSGHPMKTSAAITIAAWIYMKSNPGGNIGIVGVRGPGGSGDPNTHNFCWELGITSAGYLRFFWQHGAKLLGGVDGLIAAALPLNEWVHVMGTRNVAGTECQIYLNGVEVGSATAQTPWDGGGTMSTLAVGNNGSLKLDGFIASAWGDLGHTADGAAFYASALAKI